MKAEFIGTGSMGPAAVRQAEAENLAVPQWVGNAVRQLYMHSMAMGSDGGDMTEIIKDIESWAGVAVAKTR